MYKLVPWFKDDFVLLSETNENFQVQLKHLLLYVSVDTINAPARRGPLSSVGIDFVLPKSGRAPRARTAKR